MSDLRPQTKNPTLGSIEIGRGVAALLVVLYHASIHVQKETGVMPFASTFLFGHAGVDFFFVISGFIILYVHSTHLGQPSRLPTYIFRRVTRIYPLFWVALGFAMLLALVKGDAFPSPYALSIDALLLPGDSMVGVSWTLRHEMLFYAFFALMLVFGARIGLVLCAVWIGFILHFMVFGEGTAPTVLYSYNLQFLMGMAVAYFARSKELSKRQSFGFLFGGIGLFAAVALSENTGVLDGYGDAARLLYGLPAALIVFGSAQLDRYHAVKPWRFWVFFGSLSYSVYLMHLFGIALANQALGLTGLRSVLGSEARVLVLAAAGIVFGVLAGMMIERPMQKWFRRPSAPPVPDPKLAE